MASPDHEPRSAASSRTEAQLVSSPIQKLVECLNGQQEFVEQVFDCLEVFRTSRVLLEPRNGVAGEATQIALWSLLAVDPKAETTS